MKKLLAILLTSSTALLVGCGGGGADAGHSSTLLSGGTVVHSPYLGTWQTACDGHERQVVKVALKTDGSDTFELTPTREIYLEAGCSGVLLGTESMSASISAAPDGIADVLLTLPGHDAVSDVRIEKINLSIPAITFHVAGPGVEYVLKDGQQQWCIGHDDGATCLLDDGARATQTVAGGVLLRDNKLYTVIKVGDAYVPDTLYVKQ